MENNEVKLEVTNLKEIQFDKTIINGTPEQVALFFEDYARYFEEVAHPKNTKVNPHFRNKYAPLDEVLSTIKPIMSKYGLSVIQFPTTKGNVVQTNSLLIHKSGAFIAFEGLGLPADKQSAQGMGSAITYGRRYTLSAIAGVSSEDDDDGNGAEPNTTPTPTTQSPKPPQKTTSKATPTKPQVDDALKIAISKIDGLAREKVAINKDAVIEAVSKNNDGSSDYKKVKTVEDAEKIISALETIKAEG